MLFITVFNRAGLIISLCVKFVYSHPVIRVLVSNTDSGMSEKVEEYLVLSIIVLYIDHSINLGIDPVEVSLSHSHQMHD